MELFPTARIAERIRALRSPSFIFGAGSFVNAHLDERLKS